MVVFGRWITVEKGKDSFGGGDRGGISAGYGYPVNFARHREKMEASDGNAFEVVTVLRFGLFDDNAAVFRVFFDLPAQADVFGAFPDPIKSDRPLL